MRSTSLKPGGRHHLAVLAGVLLTLVLAVIIAFLKPRHSAQERRPERESSGQGANATDPLGDSRTDSIQPALLNGVPSGGSSAGEPADARLAFDLARKRATRGAERLVWTLVKERGGIGAIQEIRLRLQRNELETEPALFQAYVARLIPWVVETDSDALASAVDLMKQTLASDEAGTWVRFQVLAGFAGLNSTSTGGRASLKGHDALFDAFLVTEDNLMSPLRGEGRYGASMAGVLRSDEQLASLLPGLLENAKDRELRALTARVMALAPREEFGRALSRRVLEDERFDVREECVKALGVIRPEGVREVLGQVVMNDLDQSIKGEALRTFAKTGPYDGETASLFTRLAFDPEFGGVRDYLAHALFDFASRGDSGDAMGLLNSLIASERPSSGLASVYVRRATEAGLTGFLPLFRALETKVTDEETKHRLSRGIQRLVNEQHYAPIRKRIEELAGEIRKISAQARSPGLPESELMILDQRATEMIVEKQRLEREYEK